MISHKPGLTSLLFKQHAFALLVSWDLPEHTRSWHKMEEI